MNNFKDIHIGYLIRERSLEYGAEISRICNFISATEQEINEMYKSESLDTKILLKWSKLLEYDFFRIYSHHLILYSPPAALTNKRGQISGTKVTTLPKFRKNVYTMEIIYFILELLESGIKTKQDIMEEYRIPKTTLYKWISKYKNNK